MSSIESMKTEIRQLAAEVARLDETRKEMKTKLMRQRKALKLWEGDHPSPATPEAAA